MDDNSFGNSEKLIANFLSGQPQLKSIIKFYYKTMLYHMCWQKEIQRSMGKVHRISSMKGSFFGYYDSCPESMDGRYVAFQYTNDSWKYKPSKGGLALNICVIEADSGRIVTDLKNIRCGNWQQGLRLTWLSNSELAYNDSRSGRLCSVIYDVLNQEEINVSNYPHQEFVTPTSYLSIDYRLLNSLDPSYGYGVHLRVSNPYGLVLVDKGVAEEICSIERISELLGGNEHLNRIMSESNEHWINHVMISPDKRSLIFIHRFLTSSRRVDRLIHYSLETGNLKVLVDEGMVSHCYWIDETNIVGFLKLDNTIGFWKINIASNEAKQLKHLGINDGHPSVSSNRLIYDSYPDKCGMQSLILADLVSEKTTIGLFLSKPKWRDEYRCDLHPRWSRNGESIYFDSTHEGFRALYKLEL